MQSAILSFLFIFLQYYGQDELMAEFGNVYCTYASDLAFPAFFNDLQNLITVYSLTFAHIFEVS
jgi:hypothetical protein